MMSLPYFPMYPTDFEAKTSHLTLEEDGAYNRLMRLCWMAPDCSLPDDNAWIMRRMRVDQDTFDRVVLVVLDEFFTRSKGRLSNARLTREFTLSTAAHSKRVSAGKKGGAAKSLKSQESSPSNAKAMPKQPEPEPEPLRSSSSGAGESADELLDEVLSAVGLKNGHTPTHWMPPAATIHVGKWKSDLGLSDAEIITAAHESRKRFTEPPNGPKALDRVMQNLAAAKQSPSLTPTQSGARYDRSQSSRAINQLADQLSDGTTRIDYSNRNPFAVR